jgi:hypothetical protein
MKDFKYLKHNFAQRISYDGVLNRLGTLERDVFHSLFWGVIGKENLCLNAGTLSTPSTWSFQLDQDGFFIQKKDSRNVWAIAQKDAVPLTVSAAHATLDRYDLVQARYKLLAENSTTVDIIDPATGIITPTANTVDYRVSLEVAIKTGTPGAGIALSPDVATAATMTGTADLSSPIDLSVNYNLKLSIDGATAVTVDCRGATPAATTRAEIMTKLNAAGFGTIATASGNFIKLTSTTTGEDSSIVLTPPTANDALTLVLGLTITSAYVYTYVGGIGWFKVGEVKVRGGSAALLITDLFGVDQKASWTADASTIALGIGYESHRESSPIDHVDGSVTELKLDASVQAKINAATNMAIYDVPIVLNLLNKTGGGLRNNKSFEYYLGTGLDTDYFLSKVLTDQYEDNLLNDDTNATTVDAYDLSNPSAPQSFSGYQCDISATTLFDVYLDATKVMTCINTNYDWTLEVATVSAGLISLKPQTTWGAFKSGTDSTSPTNLKIVKASDGSTKGLQKSSAYVDITLLFNKTAFDAAFQGTAYRIVITKDGQVYRWDGVGVPSAALTESNFVYGYEMLLQPSEDGGSTAKAGTTAGQNDAGWEYRKIATKKHKVYVPENTAIFLGSSPSDGEGTAGDKYYDEFGSKAFQLKTQAVLQKGNKIGGFSRLASIVKCDITETAWENWVGFVIRKKFSIAAAYGTQVVCRITWYKHTLTTGDYVDVTNPTTTVPAARYQVTVIDANTVSIPYDNSGGSAGTCDVVAIKAKNVVLEDGVSILSKGNNVIPFLLKGFYKCRLDLWDVETDKAYQLQDAGGNNYDNMVHEHVVCDGVNLDPYYGLGLTL